MATLKDVKQKIAGVKKTQQITRAMNMVAASRLRGAQMKMEAFRPYAGKFREVLGSIASRAGENAKDPLMIRRDEVKHVHIILFTSDRGLCGGFNSSLIAQAIKIMIDVKKENADAEFSFTCFGRKGFSFCQKNDLTVVDKYIGVVGSRFDFSTAVNAGNNAIYGFLGWGKDEYKEEKDDLLQYDEVYLVYGSFVRMSLQVAKSQKILPVNIDANELAEMKEEAQEVSEVPEDSLDPRKNYLPKHLCEPSPEKLLREMMPRNIYVQLYNGLLETSASEHAARMFAMENATRACKDIIRNLQLSYNKARQAAITSELVDIVSGAGALQG